MPPMLGHRNRRGTDVEMAADNSNAKDLETPLLQSGPGEDEGAEKAYEAVLDNIGFGKFQIFLLLVCGWANASDAVEVLCISFVLPSAECDLELSSGDKALLSAIIFVGMMFGGYFWGSLGDQYGRRSTLITSLLINCLGGTVSAFSSSFTLFTIARFVSGLGVGGSIPVVWSYFAEFQVARNRGTMLSLLACSWMVGNILTAGVAWIVIPSDISSWIPLASWRFFVLLCVIPAFSAAIFLFAFPESPKYLLKSGRPGKAKAVLRQIYILNNGATASSSFLNVRIFDEVPTPTPRRSCAEKSAELFDRTKALFQKPHKLNNALMLLIFFTISFGYYGMWLWMPQLFAMAAERGEAPCSLFSHGNSTPPVNTTEQGWICVTPTETFSNSLYSTLATFPGNVVSVLFVDRLGRKPLLVASMVLSGVCVFFMWLIQSETDLLILSCLFGGFSIVGWNVLDCLSCELFPTQLRGTAIGLQLGLGRVAAILANVVFGELIAVNCAIPVLLVASFMILGGLIALKLPRTTGVVLS